MQLSHDVTCRKLSESNTSSQVSQFLLPYPKFFKTFEIQNFNKPVF